MTYQELKEKRKILLMEGKEEEALEILKLLETMTVNDEDIPRS